MGHTTCSRKRKLCNKDKAVEFFFFSALGFLSKETLASKLTKQLREICHEEFFRWRRCRRSLEFHIQAA